MLHCLTVLVQRIKPKSPSEEDDWRAIQAQHRRSYICRCLLGTFATGALGWLLLTRGAPPTQSDLDALALRAPKTAKPFRAVYSVDARILSSIDMAKVHGQLLPAWVISLQHLPHSIGHRDAEKAFNALRDEAGKDPNLDLLLDRLHEKLMDGMVDFHGEINALVKGWNDYLAQGGVPFRLEHHLEKTVRGSELRVRCYRVIADVPVLAAHSKRRVLLLARQDRTNLVEAFLGQTSTEQGTALVVTDRIAEYAIDRLWPLFEPRGDPAASELLSKVHEEAVLALGESVADVLARSFSVHRSLENELSMVAHRRGCGSSVIIDRVPWDGLSERSLAMVNRVAQKNGKRPCARVALTDADRIGAISRQLREHENLELALGTLAGWFAKAVVAHEARHLTDDEASSEAGTVGLCRGCPVGFDFKVRAEIAAYLASFETHGVGYVALLQACGIETDRKESHSAALAFLLPKLLVNGCTGPIPDDFYARAAAVRLQLFGPNNSVDMPRSIPLAIPIRQD